VSFQVLKVKTKLFVEAGCSLGEILRGENGKIRRNGKTGREMLGWAGKRDGKREMDFTSRNTSDLDSLDLF
jgi:hypothetical protein